MSKFSDLFGEIPSTKPTDRLFFALFSSEDAIPRIVKTSQQLLNENGANKLSH
jgi:hypothetical protein